jgi:3-deoxy-D-manno-octulosonate 8-phosphate phosphatase (KDO 8-P phosphatase)
MNKTFFNDIKLIIFDFDGVFTNNKVIVSESGVESVICNRSDGIGLSRLREIGVNSYIVSTEKNPVVLKRAEKLKINCYNDVSDKSKIVKEISMVEKVDLKNVCFVGNDINDIPALKICGFPVGVKDSYDEIKPYIKFTTKNKGGEGAVREICDLIFFQKKNE